MPINIGSPPQVRGKLFVDKANDDKIRITPAGAGKTINGRLSSESEEDHPRRCGENPDLFTLYYSVAGSPPQVRGKRKKNFQSFSL